MASNNTGKIFENVFVMRCQSKGVAVTRVPDGCKQSGNKNMFRVTSPWDFVLSYRSQCALIDTKTFNGTHFPSSKITLHQIVGLKEHEKQNVVAGYVIWLRKTDKVFYMGAAHLEHCYRSGGGFNETAPGALVLGDMNFDIRKVFKNRTP